MNQSIVQNELERHKTGIRGKKIFLMVAFLFAPAFLCLANLIIMIVLYTILDINYKGMSSMSFFKDPQYIKWILDADFENVILHDSTVRGFSDQSLEFHGDNQNVDLSVEKLLKSSFSVTPKGTFIKAEEVKFVNPHTKKTILDFTSGTHVPIIGEFQGQSMIANIIQTPRVVSHEKDDLNITSTRGMKIIGNEGLYADSKFIHVRAKNSVYFSVQDEKYMLTLDGKGGGVRVEPGKLPRTQANIDGVDGIEKYRLCICIKTGVLFRARVTSDKITCAISTEAPC